MIKQSLNATAGEARQWRLQNLAYSQRLLWVDLNLLRVTRDPRPGEH
jgi:hypothetical protein